MMLPIQPNPSDCLSYAVKEFDHLSLKTKNNRDLPLKVYACEGGAKLPIIIFSHGAGASKNFYKSLGYFWASQGYVCIHPTHRDSIAEQNNTSKKANFLELMGYVLKNHEAWIERVNDISLIIDSLNAIEEQEPELKGRLNSSYIGVGGHSFGAYTAQLAGGVTITIPNYGKEKSFLDKRICCLLLLSPQGVGQQGLNQNSWKNLNLPTMVVTGTHDRNAGGQGPEWRKAPFDLSPPNNKYFVLIEDAHHFSFGGDLKEGKDIRNLSHRTHSTLSEENQNSKQTTILNHVKEMSLAFWNTHLKNDDNAKTYLTNFSSDLAHNLEGVMLITR